MQATQATATVDEAQERTRLKQLVEEVLREKPDLLREVVEEILEDIGMARAIEEAQDAPDSGEMVSREEIFGILRGEEAPEAQSKVA